MPSMIIIKYIKLVITSTILPDLPLSSLKQEASVFLLDVGALIKKKKK